MSLTFYSLWLGWFVPVICKGVAIGITVVGQHAHLKASAIQLGEVAERDG